MARHKSVQQECTAVLERSLQGLVDAQDTMSGLAEDIDELDGQTRTNEEEGDETKREGDEAIQRHHEQLGRGRGRLQVLHDEATVAAREVAEEEKALELEKMQRQLEKEMREADEKLKEKEARVRAPQSCLACTLLDLCRDVCGLRVASVCYDRCAGEPAVQGAAAASE